MSIPLVRPDSSMTTCCITHVSSPFPEKRKAEAERIRQKYPDRIPVSQVPSMAFEASSDGLWRFLGNLRESRSDGYTHH